MSTTSYDTKDSSPAEAGFLHDDCDAAAGSKLGDSVRFQPLSRTNRREARYGSGDSDASDDDLIFSAQRGTRKLSWNCAGGILL